MTTRTYWNGEVTECRRVTVLVGAPLLPTLWHVGLQGQKRAAVEVNYHGVVSYLDDEDGTGWAKVTEGHGGPRWPHRGLPSDSVVVGVRATAERVTIREGNMTHHDLAAWPGVKYYARFVNLGMQMAQQVLRQPMRGIWVECTTCGRMDAMRDTDYSLRRMTDEQATSIFVERGWSVRPTLCPDHAAERGES